MRVLSGLAVVVVIGAGGLATGAHASTRAAGQYGPPPPPTAPAPPGFTSVVTCVTIGPAGGTIGPVTVEGAATTLTVPAGAFPTTVQICLTAGNQGVLAPAVFTGFHIVTAVGVQVQLHGATYPGTFLRPLLLTARTPRLTPASVVTRWNGASLTVDPAGTAAAGVASVSFDSDPDFVFLSPTSVSPTPVPKATVPVTGKPLLGEGLLAGGLLAGGLGGLGLSRRRRIRG